MKDEILSHWHPNITINLVTDQTNWVKGTVPPPLDEYVQFLPSGQTYLPVVYYNDYWNMMRDYQPLNNTIKELELYITYQPLSLFKWQLVSGIFLIIYIICFYLMIHCLNWNISLDLV